MVDHRAWFFKAHFYQDPVCPGSLGIESLIQLLRYAARERWPDRAFTHMPLVATGQAHTWRYRGQIRLANKRIEVEAVIHKVEEGPEPALWADGYSISTTTGGRVRLHLDAGETEVVVVHGKGSNSPGGVPVLKPAVQRWCDDHPDLVAGLEGGSITLILLAGFIILCIYKGVQIVSQSEKHVVERFGRLRSVLGPGINFIVPFLDRVAHKVSILERQLPTATQDAITMDNVLVQVDTSVFYRILQPEKTVYRIRDVDAAIATTVAEKKTMKSRIRAPATNSMMPTINSSAMPGRKNSLRAGLVASSIMAIFSSSFFTEFLAVKPGYC